MLLVIPLGYFVAVFLLVTGVMNCKEFIQTRPENMDSAALMNGAALAAWPLIVAVVILLLIQVCRQIESLRLVASYSPVGNNTPAKDKKKKHATDENEEEAPATRTRLAHLATPPATQPQRYPNSPIPGASRPAPQPVAAQAQSTKPTAPQPKAEAQPGLSYFKVD